MAHRAACVPRRAGAVPALRGLGAGVRTVTCDGRRSRAGGNVSDIG